MLKLQLAVPAAALTHQAFNTPFWVIMLASDWSERAARAVRGQLEAQAGLWVGKGARKIWFGGKDGSQSRHGAS